MSGRGSGPSTVAVGIGGPASSHDRHPFKELLGEVFRPGVEVYDAAVEVDGQGISIHGGSGARWVLLKPSSLRDEAS